MKICKCFEPAYWVGKVEPRFKMRDDVYFYDGPLSAVLECKICGTEHLVSVLAWDQGLERIFGCTPMEPQTRKLLEDYKNLPGRVGEDYDGPLRVALSSSKAILVLLADGWLKQVFQASKLTETLHFQHPDDVFGPEEFLRIKAKMFQ